MSEAIEYTLAHPIMRTRRVQGGEAQTEEISVVTVRRPKGKDLRMLDGRGKIAQSLTLIAALTGLTSAEVDNLDGEDITGLGEIVAVFFPEPQKTGGTSSET